MKKYSIEPLSFYVDWIFKAVHLSIHATTTAVTDVSSFGKSSLYSTIMKQSFLMILVLVYISLQTLSGQTVSPMGYTFVHPWNYYQPYNDNNETFIRLNLKQPIDRDFTLTSFVKYSDNDMVLSITSEYYHEEVFAMTARIVNCSDQVVWDPGEMTVLLHEEGGQSFNIITCHLPPGDYRLNFQVYDVNFNLYEAGSKKFLVGYSGQYSKINNFGDQLYCLKSSGSSIKRPMLFIEGFDFVDEDGYTEYLSKMNDIQQLEPTAFNEIEVYFLNLKDPYRDLRDNAMSVLGTIQYLNSNSNCSEGTIVVGFSMGGILARYALAFAEHNNIQHYCKTFISYDSPNQGAIINDSFQNEVKNIYNDLDETEDWLQLIPFCGGYTNRIRAGKALIKPYIDALKSKAAKQLLRNNIESGNWTNYERGSDDFVEFFREINEEPRNAYYGSSGPNIMNYCEGDNSKPGFPYKYNSIYNIAVSNGGTITSGDVPCQGNPLHQHVCSLSINHFGTYNIDSKSYDTQPGSSLGIPNWLDDLGNDINATIYYDPVFVPTRSSLYLKPESIDGNSPFNEELSISSDPSHLGDIVASSIEMEEYLNDHSMFSEVIYNNNPNFVDNTGDAHGTFHNAFIENEIEALVEKYQDLENRATCYITGTVNCPDYSDIEIQAYKGSSHLPLTDEYRYVKPDGSWKIPYTLVKSDIITIKFLKNGYLPSIIDYTVQYSPTSSTFSLNPIQFYAFDLNNIMVSKSGMGSFPSINSAIEYLENYVHTSLYDNTPIKIKILPDSYCETIDLSPLADVNIPSLTIIGWGEGVIINRQVDATCYPCIIMTGNQGENIFIDNLTINHASVGVLVDLLEADRITISNCTFNNCSIDTGTNATIVSNMPTTISNCTISDIHKGCISLENNTNRPSIINGCNLAHKLNAISITGTGHFDITNNSFNASMPFVPDPDGYIMLVSNVGSAIIAHNIFFMPEEQLAANCIYITGSGLDSKQITINNNTYNYMTKCVNLYANSNVKLENNIFANSQIGIKDNYPYNTVSSSYNLFKNVDTPFIEDEGNPASHPGCIYTTEEVMDSNYQPVWNSTYISPCIDAGIGEKDPDKTPPDIGARRAISHEYWEYTFATQADQEKWYWVSYPVLNSRTNNMLKASTFFDELLSTHSIVVNGIPVDTPTYLDEIRWYNQQPFSLMWEGDSWNDLSNNHYVTSPQGYKIKFIPETRSVTLKESGFRTASETQFRIYGGVENWLGYFRADAAWPHDVFASIWDDINMIKTKDWCLIRARTDGDYWGLSGKLSPLKSGDMVVVTTNNTHDFQWNNANATPPESKAAPEHFIFNEKQDYVPVYVTIPDSVKINLKEIGLYLDGVCKGAVVVEDSLEQICAYLDINEKLEDGVVEFVFYYNPDKAAPRESKKMHLDSSRLAAQFIKGNQSYPYYNITLSSKDMENVVPIELALNQNFPNPFNPSTTISYQLPASGDVRLEIYNLRGQLVNTLINAKQDSGYHSITWNGTDSNNHGVASGVYFYRLCSAGKNVTRKMLLMK